MDQIRSFIAIEMTPELREHLQQLGSELRRELKDKPIRWLPAENIHLTIKFLGEIPEADIDRISEALVAIADKFQPFDFSTSDLGVFPQRGKARIIWLGVNAPKELMHLQQEVESSLQTLGFQAERRQFSPHLTLGRVQRSATAAQRKQVAKGVRAFTESPEISMTVTELALMKSTLKSDGARYSRLFAATIKAEKMEV